jgi:predicted acyltransferase
MATSATDSAPSTPSAPHSIGVAAGRRIASLDQFRGYTVAGMFLVNFVGGFEVIKASWPILKHHNNYGPFGKKCNIGLVE